MEFNIRLNNRQVLRGIIRSPGENIRGVILLVHGLGEHIQRYNHLADEFNRADLGFAGVDLPGHGRSDGSRGHIKSYGIIYEMIDILLNESRKTFPGIPVFLYGHSLGGGIVLSYLLRKEPRIKGAIVTSPWLRLTFQPEKFKVLLAAMMKNFFPGLVQPSGLNVSHISHDKEVVEQYIKDPLVHGKISLSLFSGALDAASYSLANASELKTPLLLMHGSEDMICSPEGSREFASKAPSTELKIWEEGYHELHNEPFRDDVIRYIIGWIDKLQGRRHS